jgi:hypothetical protein
MSDSARIHHPTARDATVILAHSRPYTVPFLCSMCGVAHEYKTYHIKVDSVGDAVVSGEILDRLKELEDNGGWEILGVELNPEPIVLDMGGGPQEYNVVFQPTEVVSEDPTGG